MMMMMMSASNDTATSSVLSCPICYETLKEEEGITIEECKHVFCQECLKLHCAFCINEKRIAPSCPSCLDVELQLDEIKIFLNENLEIIQRLEGLKEIKVGTIDEEKAPTKKNKSRRPRRFHPTKKSERAIRKLTKPCPGCQAPIIKESGCDHIVCPVCDTDFCWSCGSHKSLSGDGSLRFCETCQIGYIDHRKIWRHRIIVSITTIFFLPIIIIYLSISTLFLTLTGGCFCCFAGGRCLQKPSRQGVKQGLFLCICLPGVLFAQEMGFSWFDWLFTTKAEVVTAPTYDAEHEEEHQVEELSVSVMSEDDDEEEHGLPDV